MMGVVVEVVLEVRPHTPIISRGYTTFTKTGAEAVKAVLKARGRCDALFAILVPDRGYVYLETRTKVGMGFRIRLWVGFTVQECRLWWSRSGWFGPMCVGASPDVRCRCAWFLVVWQHGVSPEKLVGHEVVREGLGRSGVCFWVGTQVKQQMHAGLLLSSWLAQNSHHTAIALTPHTPKCCKVPTACSKYQQGRCAPRFGCLSLS